ncbi:BlaR1 peptidase M56 [Xanthomonas sp. GW]|uniref:M56 family metallopeptidase n=1 Tax=Xanthomonas sp. GW TaxID=2724121 RepID=UPI00163AB0CC|nr:M56 family metallopeptidase [Xanthomonas sp. GW]QNH20767.1 BlaR1 peptidase M56 [Xanthomonas sp. GW]
MDTLVFNEYGVASALASALVHSLWQDTLLAIAAAFTLALLKHSSAAWRHTVAMAFLVMMLLVPTTQFLQLWQQPVASVSAKLPAVTLLDFGPFPGAFVQESEPVAGIVVLLWLLGAGWMLARHVVGLRMLDVMERGTWRALPPHWQQRVRELQGAIGIAREVVVRLSHDVVTPFAARLLRPVIWLPMSLLSQTPVAQIEALLAHELAHIARKDWLWNGLQCVIESLLFFHPAAWWLGRRVRQEREHACDDLAVAACGDAIALAEALMALECQRHPSPHLVLAAQGGLLMQRITRLLSGPPSRGRLGARVALGILLASAALIATQVWANKPNVHITSTAKGATTSNATLGPGDVREITADDDGMQRSYRASVDAQGRLVEVYKENGQPHPIDSNVRAWIAKVGAETKSAEKATRAAEAEAKEAEQEAQKAEQEAKKAEQEAKEVEQ